MNAKRWPMGIAFVACAGLAACAPAYHWYSGCTVDCRHCVRPPLPYERYSGCACHSDAVRHHLTVPTPTIATEEPPVEAAP